MKEDGRKGGRIKGSVKYREKEERDVGMVRTLRIIIAYVI